MHENDILFFSFSTRGYTPFPLLSLEIPEVTEQTPSGQAARKRKERGKPTENDTIISFDTLKGNVMHTNLNTEHPFCSITD